MKKPSQVLPTYVGESLPIQPPFYFRNMTACVFPLRAKLVDMQRFCDGYLNIIPRELGYFRASIPYVHLMMLDYGRLAIQAANMGWFAQREVMFSVPIEWYKWDRGRYVFHDWASVAAFIYVDDPMSMKLGRTLMGWPKVMVQLTGTETGWMSDPGGLTSDAALSADVVTEAYAGKTLEKRRFLEIKSSLQTSFRIPGSVRSPLAPWTFWTNAMQGAEDLAFDTAELLRGFGVLPHHRAASPDNYARMLQLMAKKGNPWRPDYSANTINLKQFRSAKDPDTICYQALTNGPMRFTSFNRAALLGETAILSGDLSGGFEINLARWPSMPIIDTLGLETHGSRGVDGVEIAALKPVIPFWYDVDMSYTQATRVAWRSEHGSWKDHEGTRRFPSKDKRFNTTIGAGLQVFTGPYRFREASLRVLPLIAERAKMQDALDRNVNAALKVQSPEMQGDFLAQIDRTLSEERFEVWGPPTEPTSPDHGYAHVYLVVQDWGKVSSETDDFGNWATRTATFYVPVKHIVAGEVVRLGLMPMVTLSEGTAQTCTLTELYGIQAIESSFNEPKLAWYPMAKGAARPLMSVSTMVLPSLGRGERTRKREILKVEYFKDENQATASGPTMSIYQTARDEIDKRTRQDLEMNKCRRAAAEVLALFRPLSVYTLKQFRDEATPERACYQALLRIPWSVQELRSVLVQKGKVQIKISEFPSLPIVSQLGLLPLDVSPGEGGTVYTVEAVDALTVQCDLRLANAEELRTRVHAGKFAWRINQERVPPAPAVLSAEFGAFLQKLQSGGGHDMAKFRKEVRVPVKQQHGLSVALRGSQPPGPNPEGVGDKENSYLESLLTFGPHQILRSLLGRADRASTPPLDSGDDFGGGA